VFRGQFPGVVYSLPKIEISLFERQWMNQLTRRWIHPLARGEYCLAPSSAASFAFDGNIERFMQTFEVVNIEL
jgi:hypothetical protein